MGCPVTKDTDTTVPAPAARAGEPPLRPRKGARHVGGKYASRFGVKFSGATICTSDATSDGEFRPLKGLF